MSFFRNLGTPRQPMPREELRTLTIAGREVPLTIRAHPRARRLTLRIEPGGRGLRLTVPPKARRGDVDAFIARHEGWAAEKLAALPVAPKVEAGATIPIAGEPHLIEHTGALRGRTERVAGDDGRLVLRVSGDPASTGRRVAELLRREARGPIEAAAARHAARVGREPKAIRLKDTRSRWGSCTAEGTLAFSWRLAMAPPHILDYLVAHECAHLRHMDHGAAFWSLCRELAPRTDEAKAWLRCEGQALHAYDFD